MKTQNNELVTLIEMHASANENGQDSLCNALYHAINELAKTLGYEGENACDELSSNGEVEIDGVCYQFDGKTSLTGNTVKYKAINNPYYALKAGLTGLPKRVSFYGAAPIPSEAYEVKHAPSIEITDSRGRVTYSNYFYGEVLKSFEHAEAVANKLNS